MNAPDPFALLRREHRDLGMLFQRHQEALLRRRWAHAARLLSHHHARLAAHIRIEEDWLLPCAPGAQSAAPRWNPEIYRAEHRKLLELAGKLAIKLARARRRGVSPTLLLALLDEEKTFKHVFEHHHRREERGLFGELPRQLSAETRSGLCAALLPQEHVRRH
ncbi:MAG TPA: hypothetical protein VFM15_03990 [Gammaproteobacteria bacterium]|nr:hypothetical protein [Gammaproteobacteria bacterium]